MRNTKAIVSTGRMSRAASLAAAALLVSAAGASHAATYYWDGSDMSDSNADESGGGGNGQWKAVGSGLPTNWYSGTGTANSVNDNVLWPTTGTENDALFAGTAGAVRLTGASLIVRDIAINTAGYVFEVEGGTRIVNLSSFSGSQLSSTIIRSEADNPRTLTINTNASGDTPVFSGSLQNGTNQQLRLTYGGPGTLTLSGTSTYTGVTTVTAGKLLITGDHSAATGTVTVSGGTLGGTGTIGGATSVSTGAFVSAGTSAGILTFDSNLTLAGGATSAAGATAVFEGGDLIDVNGTLTLNSDWNLTLLTGFQDGGSVTLFTYATAGATLDLTPDIDSTLLGFVPTGSLTLTNTGTSIVLNGISVVPEPASMAALAVVFGMLGGRRFRR